ncbi:MAG: glycosyltransferase [Mariprofundales bacterium]
MNILHVNMSLDPVTGGGTVERVRQLHLAMRGVSGVRSRVLSLALGDVEEMEDVLLLPCWSRRWYLPAPKLLTIFRLVQWADVIHLMNHWTILNAMVYWLARMTGTPYIVCPAGALPLFGRSSWIKRGYNWLVGESLVKHCATAISVAEDEEVALQQYGVSSERIVHIPNGVRQEDFACADVQLFRKHAVLGPVDYLLFVGRLNEIKGPDILLDAFVLIADDFPSLHLVFAGPDGGVLDALRSRSDCEIFSSRVHFTGYVGNNLKSSAYHGASLLIVPSRQEAMSIVALEGAVCGTPVVLTDCCGFNQLRDAGAARLAEVSAKSIAEQITVLMHDAALRAKMGAAGRDFALGNYTWDIAAVRYLKACEGVLMHV